MCYLALLIVNKSFYSYLPYQTLIFLSSVHCSSLSPAIAPAFEKRADLRTPVCNALRKIASQARQSLQSHGETIGHADPTLTVDDELTTSKNQDQDEDQEEDEDQDLIPSGYTADMARSAVQALRVQARTWLPLLLNAFISTPANQRGHIGGAVAAYACVCESDAIATMFRAAITKLMKATEQARTGELGRDAVFEGGETDTERCCTFMEAALLLSGGLDVGGIQVLWKAAVPGMKGKDPAIQKKSYKILAYLCESRLDFVQPHFQEVLQVLLQGTATAVSAAKRYRLRCLKAAILELVQWTGPDLDLSELPGVTIDIVDMDAAMPAERARHVITPMVTEIILSVKEANKRTRAAAFDLLIDVARAIHEAEPPTEDEVGNIGGGLLSLVHMVLGGFVGATPHMISASVMSLARLLFEFAPVLAGLIPSLLPSVLMLLRSKAREVIKAVLGFVKVVTMRLPAPELLPFIPAICEGILLWAEDSKNKFRLKVRVILERLARRCGFEALEGAVPEAHRALLTHIRKQHNRKERRRNSGASEMDWDEQGIDDDDTQSRKSKARSGRTATRSAWNSDVFSDEDDDDGVTGIQGGAKTLKTLGDKSTRRGLAAGRSVRSAPNQAATRRLPSSGDPLDLLDAVNTRRMVRGGGAGGKNGKNDKKEENDDKDDFERGKDGRMVIKEEVPLVGKRKRGDAEKAGFDSDDSDFEDLKGFTGLSLALKGAKSVGQAASIAASLGGKSLGARSQGARSMGGRSRGTAAGGEQGPARRGGQHTGDRFKAKKKGSGGDVKGNSKVEPYAYWPLDRKLLNRRVQKTKSAKSGLDRIVNAGKDGASKGHKAKKMKR